jgi:hypothetical protein
MISSRLKKIFVLSIPIFIIHEVEEFVTGFWKIDPFTDFVARLFPDKNLAIFTIFNLELIIFMIFVALALKSPRWQLRMFTVFGLVYLFELSHVVRLFVDFKYYPGMITAFLSLIAGFFFWKELIKIYKGRKS